MKKYYIMKNKLNYREDIDGLRAIAIIFVILYHSRFSFKGDTLFNGGYVGVDVFFVISGYLICRLLFTEIFTTGKLSILLFFNKRIRRIFPALIFLIFLISPIAFFTLLPQDLIEYCKSIFSSIFFSSNIFFFIDQTAYASENSLLKPLLHTWSLGVEEQFYILLPFLIFVINKFYKKSFMSGLIIFFLLSLLSAEYFTGINKDFSFYFIHTRLWEITTGGIVALLDLTNKRIRLKGLKEIGITMIFLSFVYFDSNTIHPGFITLLPTIGTALVLIDKDESIGLISKFLKIKILKKIGILSYSLYLWHFPILSFYRHKNIVENNFYIFILIFISFLMSNISHKYVEAPLRNIKKFGNKIFYKFLIISIISISILSGLFITRILTNETSSITNVSNLLDNTSYRQDHLTFELKFDYKIKENNKENILIVGNSHAEDLLQILIHSNVTNNYNITLTSSTTRKEDINYQLYCFENFLLYKDSTCPKKGKNIDFGPNISDQYKNSKYVFLATRWSENDIIYLDNIINQLLVDGKKVVVVANSPESEIFGLKKLNIFDRFLTENKRLPKSNELTQLENQLYDYYFKNQKSLSQSLENYVESYNNSDLIFADRTEYMCNKAEKRCYLFFYEQNIKVFWDYGHITTAGSKILASKIDTIGWLDFLEDNE